MEFYLDDCADDDELIAFLSQAGHTVHTPRTEQTRGLSDPDHLRYAAGRGYTLVTSNPADFRALHETWHASGIGHAGILLICQDNIKGKDLSLLTSSMPSRTSSPRAFQSLTRSTSLTTGGGPESPQELPALHDRVSRCPPGQRLTR